MDDKDRRMLNYVYKESNKDMKTFKSWLLECSIDEILWLLWFSVTNAEIKIRKSKFTDVCSKLEEEGYTKQPELQSLINKCLKSETWTKLREHGAANMAVTDSLPVPEPTTISTLFLDDTLSTPVLSTIVKDNVFLPLYCF